MSNYYEDHTKIFTELLELKDALHDESTENRQAAKKFADELQSQYQQVLVQLSKATQELKRCTQIFNTHYLSVGLGGIFLGALLMHVVNVCISNDAISRELQAIRDQDSANELQEKYSKYEKYEPLLQALHKIDLKDDQAVTLNNNTNFIKGKLKDSKEELITLRVKREFSTACDLNGTKCYTNKDKPDDTGFHYGTGELDKVVLFSLKK